VHVSWMSWWKHSARVSGNWAGVSVLVGEGLEVHGLGRVHFLAESEQVERGIGADFIFHALREKETISECACYEKLCVVQVDLF